MMKNGVGKKNLITREFWLEKTLKNIPPGKKILDAGAGEMQYKKFCNHLKYVSQDISQYKDGGDGGGLEMEIWDGSKVDIISDIINIPVKDRSFDVVMCIEVLEHLLEPEKAIKEFQRILKPGGVLILTAPFCSLTHFSPYYYHTGFSKNWYSKILDRYDFDIKELSYNGNYFEYLAQEVRRIWDVSQEYSSLKVRKVSIHSFFIIMILRLLKKLSVNNIDSEKLLCFGFHVLAVKKNNGKNIISG